MSENEAQIDDVKHTDPKQRGLGRGLAALLGEDILDDEANTEEDGLESRFQRRTLPIEWLKPSALQPRRHFDVDRLKELAASIERHGVMQPLVVRPIADEDNAYEIVAGERRWRACQKAQLHSVPVVIQYLTDAEVLEIALIENLQREDLNTLEEAEGYQRLMDEFGHTQEKLAEAMGKSRSHVANLLRMLTLPEEVKDYVRTGQLSSGHARTLIGAKDPVSLAHEILDGKLSVREAEARAKGTRVKPQAKHKTKSKGPDTRALESEISNRLGLSVSINPKGQGGSVTIQYSTLDQLDDVVHRLSQNPNY